MTKQINLFEFKKTDFPNKDKLAPFKAFLDEIWQKYKDEKDDYFREEVVEEECKKSTQPFFNFNDNEFCPRGYVGYVKFEDFEFNLYPKIFKNEENDKNLCKNCTKTLLLWLQYSNFRKMPNFQTSLDFCDANIFEILIYLFAKYTTDLFATSLYQHYETISEETNFLKGKLDFTNYVKNIACGKSHKFCCSYDSFEFNNKFNQIIKYVANMLLQVAKNLQNQSLLYEIILILDEVDDVVCNEDDCDSVYINRFMEDFVVILDYCKIFLSNCVSINSGGGYSAFAFLLRTEKLYEDFISNYMKKICPMGYVIRTQRSISLDKSGKFNIQPDILVYEGEDKPENLVKIIDVKYKDANEKDVSQADVYQLVTYGFKLGCKDLTLLYPKIIENQEKETNIKSGFGDISLKLNFKFINSTGDNEDNLESELKKIIEAKETND